MRHYVGGELVPADEATVGLDDPLVRHGDGVYETMAAYGGTVFEAGRHVDSLCQSCEAVGIEPPDADRVRAALAETLSAADRDEVLLTVTATGRGDRESRLLIRPEPLPDGGPVTVQTAKRRRAPDAAIPAAARTHNRLDAALAREELAPGSDDALLRGPEGTVLTATRGDLLFVDGDGLHVPRAEDRYPPRVARDVALELADEVDLPVSAGDYRPERVREAEEAFLAGTRHPLAPIDRLDGIEIGGGPVHDLLSRLFDERIARVRKRDKM